jgi:branched-chain amino acid transport system permease protein
MATRANLVGALAFLLLAAMAPAAPAWIVSLATIAFAYAVALIGRYTSIRDVLVLIIVAAAAAGLVAFLIGFLLARYREIFFAMLSLAMSMILYGILVKTETLGSTDGFHVETATLFGVPLQGREGALTLFWLVLAFSAAAALIVAAYFRSVAGTLAVPVRDNEIRVEFLGISVTRLIHLKLVAAGILAGIGGALAALSVAHVDPNMSYWTTSGGFVFVTILAGSGSVAATFVASFVFELVRSIAVDIMPGTWQLILGSVLLLTILFLPEGLSSVLPRLMRRKEAA